MLAHLTGTIVSRILSDDHCPSPAERFVLPAAKHKQPLVFMVSQDKRPRYPAGLKLQHTSSFRIYEPPHY